MCDCKSRGWANRECTTTQLVFKSAVSHVGRACTRHQLAMIPFRAAVANITIIIMNSKINQLHGMLVQVKSTAGL